VSLSDSVCININHDHHEPYVSIEAILMQFKYMSRIAVLW